jgi:hypothetical protein
MTPPVELLKGYTACYDIATQWATEGGRVAMKHPYLEKTCYTSTHLTNRYIQKTTELVLK